MKRKGLFLFLSILPFLLMAQKASVLTGKVGTMATEASLTIDPFGLGIPKTYRTNVVDGSFSIEFAQEGAGKAVLELNKQRYPLFFHPGEAQQVVFDGGKATVSGAGSANSNALLAFWGEHKALIDSAAMHPRLHGDAIDALEVDLFEGRNLAKRTWAQWVTKPGLSDEFKAMMEGDILHNYDRWLLAYPVVRANARPADTEMRNLPNTYEEPLEAAGTELSRAKKLVSEVFREHIWYYVTYFSIKANGFQKFKDATAALNGKCLFAQEKLEGDVQIWFIAHAIARYRNLSEPAMIERWMATLEQSPQGKVYAKYLKAVIAETKPAAAATDPPKEKSKGKNKAKPQADEKYKFQMVGLDGQARYLSEFKGKVVYIDFWASWCGPCRSQFPHSKVLKEKIQAQLPKKQRNDVVFLYISIDQDEAAWKKAIETLGIEGEHGFSNAKWQDGAGAVFGVNSIPRYMIMNRNGEIVEKNAKRPSMEGVMEDILKHL